ncbi:hypothetical protein JYT72_03305 [Crocinitomix catalasitica]|nr:hypothetical protein [Crocinitomix catalasitica]
MLKRSQLLLAIIICLFLQSSYSQNAVKPIIYHWGYTFTADASYRFLFLNDYNDEAAQTYKSARNSFDEVRPRFSFGVDFNWELREKWGITIGIYYAMRGYKNRWEDSTVGPATGFVFDYVSVIENWFQSVDLPLIIHRAFVIKDNFGLDLSLGYIGSHRFSTINHSRFWYTNNVWSTESTTVGFGEGNFFFDYDGFLQAGMFFRWQTKSDRIFKVGPEIKVSIEKSKISGFGGERYYTVGFKTVLLFGRRANFRQ